MWDPGLCACPCTRLPVVQERAQNLSGSDLIRNEKSSLAYKTGIRSRIRHLVSADLLLSCYHVPGSVP